MCHLHSVPKAIIAITALVVNFASPPPLWAKGVLDNPQPDSGQSGIGVISGWVCNAGHIDIVIDEVATLAAAYGTDRGDTVEECGDTDNGFGLLLNWNLLGDGQHTVHALADGVEFGSATFTVTTLGGMEFVHGAKGGCQISDFPSSGTAAFVHWEESLQNFVIESVMDMPQDPSVGTF
ncbi:MAG: hypothetical protein HY268_27665 [Deltaproteobacteria bacterium]|nr:hypothetical protein [Deltaproteobacteria bacterium]